MGGLDSLPEPHDEAVHAANSGRIGPHLDSSFRSPQRVNFVDE
jgi:hypothetical protein